MANSCENRVAYTVPKEWDYVTLDYKCGSTGIDGEAVLCESCADKVAKGRMAKPGYCIHGTPLMDPTDSYDIFCEACEVGE